MQQVGKLTHPAADSAGRFSILNRKTREKPPPGGRPPHQAPKRKDFSRPDENTGGAADPRCADDAGSGTGGPSAAPAAFRRFWFRPACRRIKSPAPAVYRSPFPRKSGTPAGQAHRKASGLLSSIPPRSPGPSPAREQSHRIRKARFYDSTTGYHVFRHIATKSLWYFLTRRLKAPSGTSLAGKTAIVTIGSRPAPLLKDENRRRHKAANTVPLGQRRLLRKKPGVLSY